MAFRRSQMSDIAFIIVSLLDVRVALHEVSQLLNVILVAYRAQHFREPSMVSND